MVVLVAAVELLGSFTLAICSALRAGTHSEGSSRLLERAGEASGALRSLAWTPTCMLRGVPPPRVVSPSLPPSSIPQQQGDCGYLLRLLATSPRSSSHVPCFVTIFF